MTDDNQPTLKILAITGGIWATRPVTEQPALTLKSWSVRQLADGGRHFVGYCPENREGRVSSAIVEFDRHTRRGRTTTGRVYELAGKPGWDSDAEYVWQRWLGINEETVWTDVTAEVAKK